MLIFLTSLLLLLPHQWDRLDLVSPNSQQFSIIHGGAAVGLAQFQQFDQGGPRFLSRYEFETGSSTTYWSQEIAFDLSPPHPLLWVKEHKQRGQSQFSFNLTRQPDGRYQLRHESAHHQRVTHQNLQYRLADHLAWQQLRNPIAGEIRIPSLQLHTKDQALGAVVSVDAWLLNATEPDRWRAQSGDRIIEFQKVGNELKPVAMQFAEIELQTVATNLVPAPVFDLKSEAIADARQRRSLSLAIVANRHVDWVQDAQQRVIQRRPANGTSQQALVTLITTPDAPRPATSLEKQINLNATLDLPADLEVIARLATDNTIGIDSARDRAVRLIEVVSESMIYDDSSHALTLLDAVAARRGDCDDFAKLYVSLSRAVGIPARLVEGVVYLESRFVRHAWAEIVIDGHWQAVDPAFGQFEADATHLRLARVPPNWVGFARLLPS